MTGKFLQLLSKASERRQLSTAYFLYFITGGLFLPYFPSYLRSRGLDAVEIGWLLSLAPLMRILLPPLFGLAADRAKGPRFWTMIAAWGAFSGIFCIWQGYGLLPLITGTILYSVFTAPTIPLLDASVMQYLQRAASRFGLIRLWGSAGFLLTSCGLGLVFPGLPAHIIIISLAVATLLFALFLSASGIQEAAPTGPAWQDLPLLLRQGTVWLLLSALFLNRVASAPFYGFYTIFVQENGLSGEIVGLTWGLAVTTEIFVMLAVDRWIDRYGASQVLAFGVGLEAIRWLVYAFFHSRSALLLLAPTHGIAFTLLYVASVRAMAEIVPHQFRTLGQGLSTAAAGCGQMAGFVAAGYLHQTAGSQGMFIAAALVGFTSVVNVFLFGLNLRSKEAEARP